MATKKQRSKRDQEALLPPDPSTTPTDENKPAERAETAEKPIPGFIADKIFSPGFYDPKHNADISPISPALSPADIIRERYGISPDQTNIPKLLYALLCEAVSR